MRGLVCASCGSVFPTGNVPAPRLLGNDVNVTLWVLPENLFDKAARLMSLGTI